MEILVANVNQAIFRHQKKYHDPEESSICQGQKDIGCTNFYTYCLPRYNCEELQMRWDQGKVPVGHSLEQMSRGWDVVTSSCPETDTFTLLLVLKKVCMLFLNISKQNEDLLHRTLSVVKFVRTSLSYKISENFNVLGT